MKRIINYVISLVLAISLIGGLLPLIFSGQYAAYAETKGEKLDSLLSDSPYKYNNDLALVAADIALATYTADKGNKSTDIDKMLLSLGCSKVKSVNYGGAKAFTVAVKRYKGSKNKGVLIIAVQGSTKAEEFIKDATAWANASVRNHKAYDYMNDFSKIILKNADKMVDSGKHYKVLITGHSIGGAAGNLVAAKIQDKKYTKRNDVFCYTFAAINSINTKKPVTKGYENIHNIYNDCDTFAPDRFGSIMVTNAGGKYGKFGHMDSYYYSHSGVDHAMHNYRDDVKNGIVKWSVLRECSKYYNPPEKPKNLSVTGGDKQITIKWTKLNQKILDGSKVGCQIQYSTNDRFRGAETIIVNGYGTNSKVVKGLLNNKTYYVRIRSFIKFKGVTVYSSWSLFKSTMTKGGSRPTEKKTEKKTAAEETSKYRYMPTQYTVKFPHAVDGIISTVVKIEYNKYGLIEKMTVREKYEDGTAYSYSHTFKYTYHDNKSIKTVNSYESVSKSNEINASMNKYGALIKGSWYGHTKLAGKPSYYKGTHRLKVLKITQNSDSYRNAEKFTFDKNGYLTGEGDRNGKRSIARDKKGHTVKIAGESSGDTWKTNYKYSNKNGRVKSFKEYQKDEGAYYVKTVTISKWKKNTINENSLRSGRCLIAVYDNLLDEIDSDVWLPSFVYEWK